MKTRHVLALLLFAACAEQASDPTSGGGKSDNPNATFHDLTTSWEMTVGYAGDATVRNVSEVGGGRMFVTSMFPKWLIKATTDGQRDTTFGRPYPYGGPGQLDVEARDVWQISANEIVVSIGDWELDRLQGFLADGSPNPAFGTAGVVQLLTQTGKPLAADYDKQGGRFLVVVARAWEVSGSYAKGPSKIEIMAYDEKTGAESSVGLFDMPSWANDGTDPATIQKLLVTPDGSIGLLASETISTENPARANVATRWSTLLLTPGQPVAPSNELAVTQYSTYIAGYVNLGGGHFDLYLSGEVDGLSMTYDEQKLIRISADVAGMGQTVSLGAGLDFLGPGLDFTHGCPASAATADVLVYGHAPSFGEPIQFIAYPKSGDPVEFTSDKIQRCLTSLSITEGGHIYAGTWDTTNAGWTAQLTKFE